MLVLTRRPGESLLIELPDGERIEVKVLTVKGAQIRLGTDAAERIPVVGKEVALGHLCGPYGPTAPGRERKRN